MSDPVTPELSNTIVATLLPPDPTVALQQEISSLKTQLLIAKNDIWQAKNNPDLNRAWSVVIVDLVENARGDTHHNNYSDDDIRQRVAYLVEEDSHDCWAPEREYTFTMKMEVTLRGNIFGKDEDTVREWIEENLPSYKLINIGAQYDSLVIDDEVLSDLEIEAE